MSTKELVDRLKSQGLTLATAESCTGGTIASMITAVPGASEVFNGGIVSYSNEAKENLLGVRPETLRIHGAVSRQTVREMAEGACRALHTDCAVATSGIAGPGGGTPQKPVGTVWMAWKTHGTLQTEVFRFDGDRAEVTRQAAETALARLLELIG